MKKWNARKVRRWAEFASSLPTDEIEGDHDFIQYGGKSVAPSIRSSTLESIRRAAARQGPAG